jgi:hypothetical protein
VFAPSRGYLEFPTESIRINITDINIMISTSWISTSRISWDLFGKDLKEPVPAERVNPAGEPTKVRGLRCLPRERMAFGFPSRIGS